MVKIHLINSMENLGGAELRTFQLFEILKRHADVRIWATRTPSAKLPNNYKLYFPCDEFYPDDGLLVFIGTYQPIEKWIELSKAKNAVIIHNTPTPELFLQTLHKLKSLTKCVRVVYASELIKNESSYPGLVQISPIDQNLFLPKISYTTDGIFKVGRLSRDDLQKHRIEDCHLYKKLLDNECQVRLMGGNLLRYYLCENEQLIITHAGSEDSSSFLKCLDCFYYRTNDNWTEAFGRVVFEAMLTGLPIVVHSRGGYCEHVVHGFNGLIFDNEHEAFLHIMRLKNDIKLREFLGRNARSTVLQMYNGDFVRETVDFYIKFAENFSR